MQNKKTVFSLTALALLLNSTSRAVAGEADIHIPDLTSVKFAGLGGVSGHALMMIGIAICAIGALFGIVQYLQTKALPVHESMGKVSHSIYETCKTYLLTQGKLLAILWVLIAACMVVYFGFLSENKPEFKAKNILNLPALSAKLKNPADPVSQFLWPRLGNVTNELSSTDGNADDEKIKSDLALALTKIIQGKEAVYGAQKLLSDKTATDQVSLNALLVQNTYAAELSKA